jgi:hypothetical protein
MKEKKIAKRKTLEGSSPSKRKGNYELLKLLNKILKNGLSPNKQKELFTSDEVTKG